MEILFWFWEMMKRDFSSVDSCTFCYKWVLELSLPLCMTKMVSACIKLGGILWSFSYVVIEGYLILDAFLCPFLIQCMMRMQALGTRLGYLCFWHCLVWRNDFIVGQQLVPRDSLSILQLRSWHFLCHCKWPRWWASASFTTYCGYHSIDIEGSCMVLYGCFGPFLPLCMMRTFFILRYLTFSSLLCERVGEVILIFMSCCWESLCRGSVGLCVVGQFATNLQNSPVKLLKICIYWPNPHKLVFGIWVWSML